MKDRFGYTQSLSRPNLTYAIFISRVRFSSSRIFYKFCCEISCGAGCTPDDSKLLSLSRGGCKTHLGVRCNHHGFFPWWLHASA